MQLDLIPRTPAILASGVFHYPDWLPLQQQNDLLVLLRYWTRVKGSWYTPTMPDGTPMKHPLSTVGYRWNLSGYYEPLVEMPLEIVQLGRKALLDCRYSEQEVQQYCPQTAIINYFPPGSSLGMHQDNSESREMLGSASPIVTISLGDSATFRLASIYSPNRPYQDIELRSGDLLVMGGYSRLAYHGVMKIFPNTCPPEVQMRSAGRISVTIRQVHLIGSSLNQMSRIAR